MIRSVATGVCVAICVAAAFMTQTAANESDKAVARVQILSVCNKRIVAQTLVSLNGRSTFTRAISEANVNLQQSQADFFGILLHRPPYSKDRRTKSGYDYYHDLQEFLNLAKKGAKKVAENPLPTIKDYNRCIRGQEQNAE
jgi:hypothetical protein